MFERVGTVRREGDGGVEGGSEGGHRQREQAGHEGDQGPRREAVRVGTADDADEEACPRAGGACAGFPAEPEPGEQSRRRERASRPVHLAQTPAHCDAAQSQQAARHQAPVHESEGGTLGEHLPSAQVDHVRGEQDDGGGRQAGDVPREPETFEKASGGASADPSGAADVHERRGRGGSEANILASFPRVGQQSGVPVVDRSQRGTGT